MNQPKKIKSLLSNYFFCLIVVFLPLFMLFVMGPSEIFFGNYKEFGIIYSEFGWKFLLFSSFLSMIIALIISVFPLNIRKYILTIIWGLGIAGYLQTMFLNRDLTQIGVNAESYTPTTTKLYTNTIFWILVILIAVFITVIFRDHYKKIILYSTVLLLGMQLIGYISLFVTTDKEALAYTSTSEDLQLNGAEQYTLSSNENIILFVMDNFATSYLQLALDAYPDLTSPLHDFTYYNNADCNYHGTYPSLAHLLTGNPLDTSLSTDDWLQECWTNDLTNDYFSLLHKHNYKVNLYTPTTDLLTGSSSLDLLSGKIDNLCSTSENMIVDYDKLYRTMFEMSFYRIVPEYFKSDFDVGNEVYTSIISYPDTQSQYSNPDFYNTLLTSGITLDDSYNYFTIQHLNGTHGFTTDENCQFDDENATYETTIKGLFTLLDAYIENLKESGIYDNSTIIITADHGIPANTQMIFYIKKPNEHHDSMLSTNAPITLNELVPTVVDLLGEDYSAYGKTIYDFTENELRERTTYIRDTDNSYPSVLRYDGLTTGDANVYRAFTYTGDIDDFTYQYDNDYYSTFPMVDSYY